MRATLFWTPTGDLMFALSPHCKDEDFARGILLNDIIHKVFLPCFAPLLVLPGLAQKRRLVDLRHKGGLAHGY